MTVQEISRDTTAEATPVHPKPPHFAEALPFAERLKPRGTGIDCWTATSSGDLAADHEHGRALAQSYLNYIGEHPTNGNVTLLGWIVGDMVRKAGPEGRLSGVELGFLRVINQYAMSVARLIANKSEPDGEITELFHKWRAAYDAVSDDENGDREALNNILSYEDAMAKITPVTAKGFAMKLIVMTSFDEFNLDSENAQSLFDDAFAITGDIPPADTEAGKRMGLRAESAKPDEKGGAA